MCKRLEILIVGFVVTTSGLPAWGQSSAFIDEYILLHSMTAAIKAEQICRGFKADYFSIAAQFDKEKKKFVETKPTAESLFDPIHKANINSIGVELWCADQWEELGPKGVIRKGFLVRKPE